MPESITILLIEDNPGDVRLTREALKEEKVANDLIVATDGVEGLDCLYQRGKYSGCAKPDIILLDLNLPGLDGREVLKTIKADEQLWRIPVIVLTTSKSEEDIIKIYNLHANCYITKPVDIDEFIRIIRSIEDFWLAIVQLPTKASIKARSIGL